MGTRSISQIPAGQFKARCLAILDDVQRQRRGLITKRGKPVARVVPVEDPDGGDSLRERALRRRLTFAAERALGRIVIVLDTHAWIWWLDGSKKLPARTRRRLGRARAIGVCAISCWEVARLVVHGRLKLDRQVHDWVASALRAPRVELLALEPEIAVRPQPRSVHSVVILPTT